MCDSLPSNDNFVGYLELRKYSLQNSKFDLTWIRIQAVIGQSSGSLQAIFRQFLSSLQTVQRQLFSSFQNEFYAFGVVYFPVEIPTYLSFCLHQKMCKKMTLYQTCHLFPFVFILIWKCDFLQRRVEFKDHIEMVPFVNLFTTS